MKNTVVLFFILIIFNGCKPAELMCGKYAGKYGYYLTLNSNNTFDYEYMIGWSDVRVATSGKWQRKGNKLLLDNKDSLMQNLLPLSIEEVTITKEDSLKFTLYVHMPKGITYVNWVLVLNGVSYQLINDLVISIVDTSEVKQFYLKAERNTLIVPKIYRKIVQTQIYTVQGKNNNLIKISIPFTEEEIDRYSDYELIDDALDIRKGKLIWSHKNVVLKYQEKQ